MSHLHATVTAGTLNVRRSASTNAERVGELRRGDSVEVLGRAGSWYEIATTSVRGFVHADFVRVDSTPTPDGFLCHDEGLCGCALAPTGTLPPADTAALNDSTRTAIRAWQRYGGLLEPLCRRAEFAPASAVGVLCVESSGQGMSDTGRLIIRFENHIFWNRWGNQHPETFRRHFTFDASRRWTGHRFRTDSAGVWKTSHAGQTSEWEAFTLARTLDESAALRSISMGASQIMGFNHAAIGYDSAKEMFDRFSADERFHVLGLFDFVTGGAATSPMLEALRREDYERFATHYNGNGQAAAYGARIRDAVAAFRRAMPGH